MKYLHKYKLFENASESPFDMLIGKRVFNLYSRDEGEQILFRVYDMETEQYENHHFSTLNDCCNQVWFCYYNGVDDLLGQAIRHINVYDWTTLNDDEDYDVLESMKFSFATSCGFFDFEIRNSHNGYYGGSVEYNGLFNEEIIISPIQWKEIKDDQD